MRTLGEHSDPQSGEPGGKIRSEPTIFEHVSTDDEIVGGSEAGRESLDINVKAEVWKRKKDAEIESRVWLGSCFVDEAVSDCLKGKPLRETVVDTGYLRSGIDLGANFDRLDPVVRQRPDPDRKRGAVLADVIRSLADSNLGPNGFFVICHRGPLGGEG